MYYHPSKNSTGSHRLFHHRRREGGAALVVAMLIFALCTALIVAMKREFVLYYQRGANIFISEQIHAYLRGAEELATLALIQDYDIDLVRGEARDDLSEEWARISADDSLPQNLDEGGWLRGGLEDLQGRLNINALVAEASSVGEGEKGSSGQNKLKWTAAQQQFIRLLDALEQPEVSQQDAFLITDSIGDWLDNDNRPRAFGAEEDYYSSLTPAYRPANRAMSSVSELRAVAYMTPEIYEAVM